MVIHFDLFFLLRNFRSGKRATLSFLGKKRGERGHQQFLCNFYAITICMQLRVKDSAAISGGFSEIGQKKVERRSRGDRSPNHHPTSSADLISRPHPPSADLIPPIPSDASRIRRAAKKRENGIFYFWTFSDENFWRDNFRSEFFFFLDLLIAAFIYWAVGVADLWRFLWITFIYWLHFASGNSFRSRRIRRL